MKIQSSKIENYKKSIEALMFILINTPKDSLINKGIVEGINSSLNIEVESYYNDTFKSESLLAELIVQDLIKGDTLDKHDLNQVFTHDYWVKKISEFIHS